jgi:hypothetical protein
MRAHAKPKKKLPRGIFLIGGIIVMMCPTQKKKKVAQKIIDKYFEGLKKKLEKIIAGIENP